MARHVIVGAGAIGTGTARLLAVAGHEVVVVSRSGKGPRATGIDTVAADATDAAALGELAAGAATLYNCASPPYHRWPRDWPPLAAAVLQAAERAGAVLVTMGNLDGYGEVDGPMTEDTPLAATGPKGRVRARVWTDALAAHRAGRVRVTEARASDYFGPFAVRSVLGARFVGPVLAGRRVSVLGATDVPHSWTYLPDIAAALVVLGTDDRAPGRAWHVPSPPPLSVRDMAVRLAAVDGAPPPRLRTVPAGVQRAVGLLVPMVRELEEVRYQLDRPFELDSTAFTATFGVTATPVDDALLATAAWWRTHDRPT